MRKVKFLILAITFVTLMASCGGRRDACPSVSVLPAIGKVILP